MRILDLAFKDLLQIVRDRRSLFFILLMPIIFTFFFGWVFGNIGEEQDPRLPVGVLNLDAATVASMALVDSIDHSDSVRLAALEQTTEASLKEMVKEEELAAALIISNGFHSTVLAGEEPALLIYINPGSQASVTAQSAIEAAIIRTLGAAATARISADAFERQAGFSTGTDRQVFLEEGLAMAQEAWKTPPITIITEQAVAKTDDEVPVPNSFGQASPGMLVQFSVFGLFTASMLLVSERKSGALQRLLTTPIRRAEVIGGHVLAMFVMVFVQEALLILLGQFAFDLGYLRAPLATLLMMGVIAFWAASLGLLIGAIANREEQVIIFTMIAMFFFSALGGAWFPLEITGETFAAIGHLLPTAWAMDGFQNIIIRGLGVRSVLLPVGIIMTYGLGFFLLAVWRFQIE